MNKKIEKKCAVCKRIIEVNQSGNGQCPHCSWYNNSLGEENENTIIFPNLVSLNKAIRLYKNGNLLRPNLNDFLDCLYSYSEMKFSYKNLMGVVEGGYPFYRLLHTQGVEKL